MLLSTGPGAAIEMAVDRDLYQDLGKTRTFRR